MTSLRSKIIPSLWGRNGIGVPLALTETLVSQKSFLHSTFYYFTMTMTCKKRNVYPLGLIQSDRFEYKHLKCERQYLIDYGC